MLIHKIIFSILIISVQQIIAQHSTNVDSITNDTSKIATAFHSKHLPKLNLLKENNQTDIQFNDSSLVMPRKRFKYPSSLNFQILEYSKLKHYHKKRLDDFELSRKKLSKFLKAKYDEIPNYDLGKFGQYLGISKKIFAIILGILSLL